MKLVISVFLLVFTVATFASAELMTTANPIGQGKWAVLGAGLSDSNVSNISALSAGTVGGYVGYGAMSQLDVYATLGQMNVSGAGPNTLNAIGLMAKYQVMDEATNPVSVSVGAGYKSLNYVQTSVTGNQMMIGVGVSKMMAPYVPYGGLIYRTTSAGGAAVSTQIDLTIGSAIAWSTQGAVFAEYTLQSITPNGGSSYTSNEFGLGVGYKI